MQTFSVQTRVVAAEDRALAPVRQTHLKYCVVVEDAVESPVVWVWAHHYLAQHLDHLGKHQEALETVRKGIAHTPTVLELYMVEAKILKVGCTKTL